MRMLILLVFILFSLPGRGQNGSASLPGKEVRTSSVRSAKKTLIKPSFPTGREGLLRFIAENLVYPEQARKEGIEGTLILQLSIDARGKIDSARVIESLGFGCDEAALEMVAQMPYWKPALREGVPAHTLYNLPIHFRLR